MTAGAHVLNVDRQYACTFKLQTPRDCTAQANSNSCDCPSTANGLTPVQLPPLCNPNTPTQQTGAKAYPTIRELMVARMMGHQGIVSSLCPIDVADNTSGNSDPLYGYRPAVAVIIDRLEERAQHEVPAAAAHGAGGRHGAVPGPRDVAARREQHLLEPVV